MAPQLVNQVFRTESNAPAEFQPVQITARGDSTVIATYVTDNRGMISFYIEPGQYDYHTAGAVTPFDVQYPWGAYDYAVAQGFQGTVADWLQTLTLQDTGIRNISASLDDTITTARIARLRRVGSIVRWYCQFQYLATTPASPSTVFILPDGFRPPISIYAGNTILQRQVIVGSGGEVNFYSGVANGTERFNCTWDTKQPWPTVLPGVAG